MTVYGFSIENFKRSEDEVGHLMQIARDGLNGFCEHECALVCIARAAKDECYSELLHKHGVRLNVIGDKSLLPADVQAAIERTEAMTKDHDRYVLRRGLSLLCTHRSPLQCDSQHLLSIHVPA